MGERHLDRLALEEFAPWTEDPHDELVRPGGLDAATERQGRILTGSDKARNDAIVGMRDPPPIAEIDPTAGGKQLITAGTAAAARNHPNY